jgi:hypothetical protein
MDMNAAYEQVTKQCIALAEAKTIYDASHLMKRINDATNC